jgi:REP element-mobilizing transposase RayT
MSRVIQRQMLIGDEEKERFRVLMRRLEEFCGVRILTYAILTNHFHIVLDVPVRKPISDRELIRRVRLIYSKPFTLELKHRLVEYRATGEIERAEALKAQFTYRMCDVSEFMKTLKQRFTQWYNRKNGRKGTLWEERFKSVLLEGRTNALRTIAGYVDLNPVRAGLADDPKDYRFCGYAEAVAGVAAARVGLGVVMAEVVPDGSWKRVSRAYRQTLFQRGVTTGGRKGIASSIVQEVLAGRRELSPTDALLCRVRYFSDGVVLGSRDFADSGEKPAHERCATQPGVTFGRCETCARPLLKLPYRPLWTDI